MAVHLPQGAIKDLRDHVLRPEAYAKAETKLRLIKVHEETMRALDEAGRSYSLMTDGYPECDADIPARDWRGVRPLEGVSYDHAMEAAVHLMAQPNYLGDPSVVEGVMNELWNTVYKRWQACVKNPAVARKADTKACERVAKIFLGMDPNYTAVPSLYSPGGIDRNVAKAMRIAEKDPVKCVTRFFLMFLDELWAVVAALQNKGVGGDQFQQQGAGVVIKKYYLTILGCDESIIEQNCATGSVGGKPRPRDGDKSSDDDLLGQENK
jgi:hypothetical protein